MELLSKEQIIGAKDLDRETVEVPEWGGSVTVSGISAKQRQNLLRSLGSNDSDELGPNQKGHMAAAFIINDDGSPMFTGEEIIRLGDKSDAALDRVISVGMRLSGMDAEAAEVIAKNSEATDAENSSSN